MSLKFIQEYLEDMRVFGQEGDVLHCTSLRPFTAVIDSALLSVNSVRPSTDMLLWCKDHAKVMLTDHDAMMFNDVISASIPTLSQIHAICRALPVPEEGLLFVDNNGCLMIYKSGDEILDVHSAQICNVYPVVYHVCPNENDVTIGEDVLLVEDQSVWEISDTTQLFNCDVPWYILHRVGEKAPKTMCVTARNLREHFIKW